MFTLQLIIMFTYSIAYCVFMVLGVFLLR